MYQYSYSRDGIEKNIEKQYCRAWYIGMLLFIRFIAYILTQVMFVCRFLFINHREFRMQRRGSGGAHSRKYFMKILLYLLHTSDRDALQLDNFITLNIIQKRQVSGQYMYIYILIRHKTNIYIIPTYVILCEQSEEWYLIDNKK